MTDHNREEREALIAGLRVAMLGTTDGDFIDPESDIPAGEMFRLAAEYVEAVFEQAHTPADEEMRAEVERVQKAAWAEIHGQDPMRKYSVGEVKRLVYSFDNLLGSLLTRRTVQGEPTDAAENNEREEKP